MPDTCTATVGQLEACENKLYSLSDDEVCNLTALPSECAFLASADCTEPDPTPRTSVVDVVSRLRGAVLR